MVKKQEAQTNFFRHPPCKSSSLALHFGFTQETLPCHELFVECWTLIWLGVANRTSYSQKYHNPTEKCHCTLGSAWKVCDRNENTRWHFSCRGRQCPTACNLNDARSKGTTIIAHAEEPIQSGCASFWRARRRHRPRVARLTPMRGHIPS